MPDDTSAQTGSTPIPDGVKVPDEARKKHPDLVEMILKSESMNVEERNYWLQVLPVMTSDQVAELRDILETEKKKLAAIDTKYSSQAKEASPEINVEEVEKKRAEAREQRLRAEQAHREEEAQKAEDLLSELDNL